MMSLGSADATVKSLETHLSGIAFA